VIRFDTLLGSVSLQTVKYEKLLFGKNFKLGLATVFKERCVLFGI
jgi:hypothetical protein